MKALVRNVVGRLYPGVRGHVLVMGLFTGAMGGVLGLFLLVLLAWLHRGGSGNAGTGISTGMAVLAVAAAGFAAPLLTAILAARIQARRLVPDLLAGMTVNACYHRVAMPVIRENATARELRRHLADEGVLFPLTVVNAEGRPSGMLTMGGIRPVFFDDAEHNLFLVKDMATPLVTCTPEDSLASVLRKFESSNYSRIPVVSRQYPSDLLGYIQYQDIMVAYETELDRLRQAAD